MIRPTSLFDELRGGRPGLRVHRTVVRNGCPVTVAYILFWAHLFWGLGLALSASGPAMAGIYTYFPARAMHLWDGLALTAAVLLRIGIGRGDARLLQLGAVVGIVVWAWADVAFFAALGPTTGLMNTALAGISAWLLYLTGAAWLSR